MGDDIVSMNDLKAGEWPDKPVEVADANFEALLNQYPKVVVDCWAPWCGPCRMIAPSIQELAEEKEGEIVFAKLNTDHNRNTAMKYQIMGIPTLLFFADGEFKDKLVGAVPKPAIEDKMQAVF